MGLREEVVEMKNEVKAVKKEKEQSLAMELIQDYKKANKRLYIIWIITFIAFIGLLGYTIWLLNDIGSYEETTTQEVTDVDTINGSVVNKGDIYGENKADN